MFFYQASLGRARLQLYQQIIFIKTKVGLTNVIRPFQLHGNISVSLIVGLHAFHNGQGSEVLDEDDGCGDAE